MAKEKKQKEVVEKLDTSNYQAKLDALERVRLDCNKQYGENTLVKMDDKTFTKVAKNSSGIVGLDLILGGGYGKGRIVEIYGPESGGKTTMALEAIAEVQRQGGLAAFIDAEHALDPEYATALGVDMASLYVAQPDSGEQALEIVRKLVDSQAIDIIVVDSVAALTPQAEIDKEVGETTVGLQAKMMSSFCRLITGRLNKTNTSLIMLNQIRMKIGVMFGNPETRPGGEALKFYASQRLEIRKVDTKEEGDEAVSNTIRVKVVKNKLASPFKKREFTLRFGIGIDKVADLISLAVEKEIIKKGGAWYSYGENGEKIGQGMDNTVKFLKEHEDTLQEITTKLYDILFPKNEEPESDKTSKKIKKGKDETLTLSIEGEEPNLTSE